MTGIRCFGVPEYVRLSHVNHIRTLIRFLISLQAGAGKTVMT